ncbi:S8 family peptidase [Shewanella zhangzhouensis]|uniref:S8 family peptidase n=1 Tax=Shewanella zhangzhouensis TaxID=2864213 RepID=UPI001C655009|nr:S8 family peptidase [Shewanella zhangzhouensis]QYK04273.1 S8 family peptidase [Shewanella zhangzhouensis]
MKLSKISMMTLAAMYAGSAAVSAASPLTQTPRPLEMTEQIKQFNANKNKDRLSGNAIQANRTSNGRNVHRAITLPGTDKLPFAFEQGLTGEQNYIIRLSDSPVSLYQGGIAGLQATSPRQNRIPASLSLFKHDKLDLQSQPVQSYRNYLEDKQQQAMSSMRSVAGDTKLLRSFQLAFNGMAMRMTQEQAARIAELPQVLSVTREQTYELHTDVGPKHIGADKLWTGETSSDRFKGEGIIVGVLDTGINSDHRAFAATGDDGYSHTNPWGEGHYVGDCEKPEFAGMCNDKLIGVRSYAAITDSYLDPSFQPELPWWEVSTPKRPANGEDYNGHGSHTASTAAGNTLHNVEHVVPGLGESGDGIGTGLKFASISGVAPHANVVMYQVCFPGDGSYGNAFYGCPGSALLSGIEDAIADGVDVINYSIGATFGRFPWEDPMEMAFLAARESGISVSASAGNSYSPMYASQARGAIDHLSPWLTSVAATTHGREIVIEGKKTTNAQGGDQPLADINGAGISGAYTGPVVEAAAYGAEYAKCNDPFPAGFFDMDPNGTPFDKAPIVVCARGDIARVLKAEHVALGGAGGFILYNTNWGDSIVNDPYVIPGIHINIESWEGTYQTGYFGLQDWLASGSGHQLTIAASEVLAKQGTADYVADFSSRGPNLENPEVMSPNLAAPGVNVFAAWADDMPFSTTPGAADYAAISGTSMASPHVAGAMALLKQSHPDWTPAQIQSALMTTASTKGVTRSQDFAPFAPTAQAGNADAGSGVINVARADKAGLLMDETGDNYRAANPRNGGTVNTLNVPYFYHESCAGSCSLMRVVTATRDGSWTAESIVHDIEGAEMLELDVFPKEFSLRKGESQAIVLKAKVLEIQAPGADSSQIQLTGDVILTPSNTEMPVQHLPVGMRFANDKLPQQVSATIHRNEGHVLSAPVQPGEIQSFNSSVFGLTKAERIDWQMKRSEARDTFFGRAEREADGQFVRFFDVPEGTKRLVFEVIKADTNAFASIDMGMDINGDGDIQWSDEALCFSRVDYHDYCAINDPVPGRYWAYASNLKYDYEDLQNNEDSFQLALALVGSDDKGNLTIEGPASSDGLEPFQMKLNYQLDGAEEGDVFYGYAGIGSDAYNSDNLGQFGVKLTHKGTDTEISTSQDAAKAGDLVDVIVNLAPNLQGGERAFTISTELAPGLTLLEDSISIGGIGNYAEGLTIDGQTLTIAATQASSADIAPHYVFTTNETDASCKVPYGDDPTYYNMANLMMPLGISGRSNQYLSIPLSANGLPEVPLYGMPAEYGQDILEISPFGYVKFDPMPEFWNMIVAFDDNFQTFPDTMVAPLWRGDVMMPETSFDWMTGQWTDDVWAAITDKHYLFQWRGGKEWMAFLSGNNNPDPDAFFDIQTIIATELDFAQGAPEVIFAYKTIRTHNDSLGSIGLHGYNTERDTFGPITGWFNDGFAYNDVDEKVKDGTVVCADYRGPQQTALTLQFQVRVSSAAVGKDNPVTVTSQYQDSEAVTVSQNIKAPGNITLIAIGDKEMDENTTLEGIEVTYHDINGTSNGIKVTGEHISGSASGGDSGSTISITPDADWHGTTEVTVTVYDLAYPDDASSTSFMLTVNSDGVEPTPPAPETPTPPANNDGGGSLGFLSLALLGLLGLGRRRY